MGDFNIYKDIAERTQGDIYLGVVGPVRTGKSTFIKKFMDLMVIPKIDNAYKKERAKDELPQSSSGKTIHTTEPKFVPNEAVEITIDEDIKLKVRLVDCVGYIVKGALGYLEDEEPKMVNTPWYEYEIPFEDAAEIGTRKVITDHSTVGLVVTTDGSITGIDREEYVEAEERVVEELKSINKPFIVVLNTKNINSPETDSLKDELEKKYDVEVQVMDVYNMTEKDIEKYAVAKEFPIIPCNLCGSQPNLQRQVVKEMLNTWDRQYPGRLETMFSAMQNITLSHLCDPKLFDFKGIKHGQSLDGIEGDTAFDEERIEPMKFDDEEASDYADNEMISFKEVN